MIPLDVILEDTDFEVDVEKYFKPISASENRCFVKGFLWGFISPFPLLIAYILMLQTIF